MKVYHIHPRKTGGTALRFLLEEKLMPSKPLPFLSDFHFFNTVPAEDRQAMVASSDFISGHFGRLGPLVPSDFLRICVLRDPLSRIVSCYNHIVSDKTDPLHAKIEGLSFCEVIKDERFAHQLCDHQSRLIVENMGERFEQLSDRQRIDCCVAFMSERVDCVGVLERPAHLMAALTMRLGIEMPATLPLANIEVTATGSKKSVVNDCLRIATLNNAIDLAMYSFVLSKLV